MLECLGAEMVLGLTNETLDWALATLQRDDVEDTENEMEFLNTLYLFLARRCVTYLSTLGPESEPLLNNVVDRLTRLLNLMMAEGKVKMTPELMLVCLQHGTIPASRDLCLYGGIEEDSLPFIELTFKQIRDAEQMACASLVEIAAKVATDEEETKRRPRGRRINPAG